MPRAKRTEPSMWLRSRSLPGSHVSMRSRCLSIWTGSGLSAGMGTDVLSFKGRDGLYGPVGTRICTFILTPKQGTVVPEVIQKGPYMRLFLLTATAFVLSVFALTACNSIDSVRPSIAQKSSSSPTPQNPADNARRITAAELHDLYENGKVLI